MSKDMSKIALAKEMVEAAESSLRSARQILSELAGDLGKTNKTARTSATTAPAAAIDGEGRIVEGVFNGQSMEGSDGSNYPVPANYASKSKLVQGDTLKLTITPDGRFTYKQIGPIERKHVIGTLTYEDGSYKVIAEGQAYKVITASVTYFKGEPGDQVTLIVPVEGEAEWGAVEHIINVPKADLYGDDVDPDLVVDKKEDSGYTAEETE